MKAFVNGSQELKDFLVSYFFRVFAELLKCIQKLAGKCMVVKADNAEQVDNFCFSQPTFFEAAKKYLGAYLLYYLGRIATLFFILVWSPWIYFRCAYRGNLAFKTGGSYRIKDNDGFCLAFLREVDALPWIGSCKTPIFWSHL